MINVILQFLELDLVNFNVHAKFYQNIPNGLRVKFHCFQTLNLGKTSTNPKCHLTISGLHHVNINVYAKCHHNIPLSSRDMAIFTFSEFGARQSLDQGKMSFRNLLVQLLSISMFTQKFIKLFQSLFHFFRIWRSAKPRPMINVILQFLELDLVNINVSAKFYQNIPNRLRVKFHCFQNLNLDKTSTNPKCHLTISWATSC